MFRAEDTPSLKKAKKCVAKDSGFDQESFDEQLARARAACTSGALAGTGLLTAVAFERRKKCGAVIWNMVIRVGGKQKFLFSQEVATARRINIDTAVSAGNLLVERLRQEGLDDSAIGIGAMFDQCLATLGVPAPQEIS
jgi:hypothetical protein